MRLSLFIDYQNVFEQARDMFHSASGSSTRSSHGQIDPVLLADLLAGRSTRYRSSEDTVVESIKVFRGRPPRNHASYHPWQRQVAAWRRNGIDVVSRPLRGQGRGLREKGIDVSLALDFYAAASAGEFEVGVLFSMDYDLAPAVELTAAKCPGVLVETAVWRRGQGDRSYSIVEESFARRHRVWRHQLSLQDYTEVRDPTNYTLRVRNR